MKSLFFTSVLVISMSAWPVTKKQAPDVKEKNAYIEVPNPESSNVPAAEDMNTAPSAVPQMEESGTYDTTLIKGDHPKKAVKQSQEVDYSTRPKSKKSKDSSTSKPKTDLK